MTTATPSWSFVTLVGDGDKTIATTDGAAGKQLSKKRGWFPTWGWILIILLVITAITLAIVLPIVFLGNEITLTKVESKLCTTGTTKPHLVNAAGSSNGGAEAHAVYLHWNTTAGANTCASSPKLEDSARPVYKGRRISEGEGIPKDVFKTDEDYLMVKIGDDWCYTYQCEADTDPLAPKAECISAGWPLVHLDAEGKVTHRTDALVTCA